MQKQLVFRLTIKKKPVGPLDVLGRDAIARFHCGSILALRPKHVPKIVTIYLHQLPQFAPRAGPSNLRFPVCLGGKGEK